jgi:hypothetical protein
MRKHVFAFATSGLLALPGGALLAAGRVAQQISPSDLNKDIVQGLLYITGLFLAILLPIAGQQLLKLRFEIKTARTEVKSTQDNSVSTSEMETVRSELGLLQETVQSLKDDLRVTAIERDTITMERNALRTEKVALIQQHTTEMQEIEKRHTADKQQWAVQINDLKAEIEELKEWKASRETVETTIDQVANRLFAGLEQSIERLIALAKLSTSERKAVEAGELKPAI